MSKAEIRQEGGKPALYVNGQITAPVLYALSDFPGAAANTAYAQKDIAAFAKAGGYGSAYRLEKDYRL